MTRSVAAWLGVLMAGLALHAGSAQAEDEPAPDLAELLTKLGPPRAEAGFYVRGSQRFAQGGRTVSLPVILTAYPTYEGKQPVWTLRQEARRKPVLSVEEVVIGGDHRPIRGSARSEQGGQAQSLTWRLEDGEIRYERTDPAGRTHRGAHPVTGPLISNGAGLVLLLRQLRPQTGDHALSLLLPDLLVQLGPAPARLEVRRREHEGQDAYVGEAQLPAGVRVRVVLDPRSGALRDMQTHIPTTGMRTQLGGLRDHGVAEVHNQTSIFWEKRGDLRAALAEVEVARRLDPEESAYALRAGSFHRKLAKVAGDEAARRSHLLAAGMATVEAAGLIGEGLRSGRLDREGAATFHSMQIVLGEQGGHDLLEVLAADRSATTLAGHARARVELQAAEGFVTAALLREEGPDEALLFAGRVARGFAEQNAARSHPSARQLGALAVRAYERLLQRRPEHARAWQDLGASRYLAGQDAGAIAALEKGLALKPKSPTARAWYGAALWRTGRHADARRQLAILDRVGARTQAADLRRMTGMR